MKIGNAQSPNRVLAAAAIFIVVSASAEAATTILYCKGVNYIYQDGIGNGPAKRETASRTITLDLQAMKAELANGDEVRTTPIVQKHGAYQGVFPGKMRVFGATVIAEQMEVDTTALWLELRYVLDDQRQFLSFTGNCRH